MKKIMFNDLFNLTRLVLEGRKNMTRRIIKMDEGGYDVRFRPIKDWETKVVNPKYLFNGNVYAVHCYDNSLCHLVKPQYNVGEVVAIAQSYQSVYNEYGLETMDCLIQSMKISKGWSNKMFVKADLMPHKIQITKIRVERLQSISNDDCLNEGITKTVHKSADGEWGRYYWHHGITKSNCPHGQYREYDTPLEAFSSLIDGISGKGTWERNPWVWVYEFELVK